MTALMTAELLRLRTVRSPRYVALGVLAFVAIVAAMPIIDPSAGRPASPAALAASLRSLAMVGVIIATTFAASNLGTDFRSGAAAITYLTHPHRARVTAARALAYAGLGFVFAGVATGVVVAVGLPVAGGENVDAWALPRDLA